MWWLLIGAGVTAFIGAMEDEKKAAKKFYKKQEELRGNMEYHRQSITRRMGSARCNQRYHKLCDAHYESHMINQLANTTYQDAVKSCRGIQQMIQLEYHEISKLKKQIKCAEKTAI